MKQLMEILKQLLIEYYVVKHLILLKIQNMMDIIEDLLQWYIHFLYKKSCGSGVKRKIMPNQGLAGEFHKPIIRKFEKRKVYSTCKDNIWCANIVNMQLICKFNKGFRFLLCVIDIFSKYAWVHPLKNKKSITITNS